MPSFSLRARWVLPVERPPIDGGYVSVAEGRIVDASGGRPSGGVVHDLGDVVLVPGLVNVHTHLEFSGLKNPLGEPGMSLPAWIRLVIAERNRGGRDAAREIAVGLRESLSEGVTTVGEIAASGASNPGSSPAPCVRHFHEAIGFSAQRVDSVFADVERRLNVGPTTAGLSPHAPYTVHPRLVDRLVQLAAERGAPVAMHLAESPEELELLAKGSGPFRELLEERSMWDDGAIPHGSRPLDYLEQLASAPRAVVIHGNYLAADEIEFIAKRREQMSVAFCPRTHAYFGHPAYPLENMLEAGVRVVLGTDSRASNPDLSLLGEVRFAAAQFASVSPESWVRMATLEGAVALGMSQEKGSLTPGKSADFVALPCERERCPFQAVTEGARAPVGVWRHGILAR
jgi:cytosine/adenosine deaminase-related metal-dependent hydrolase